MGAKRALMDVVTVGQQKAVEHEGAVGAHAEDPSGISDADGADADVNVAGIVSKAGEYEATIFAANVPRADAAAATKADGAIDDAPAIDDSSGGAGANTEAADGSGIAGIDVQVDVEGARGRDSGNSDYTTVEHRDSVNIAKGKGPEAASACSSPPTTTTEPTAAAAAVMDIPSVIESVQKAEHLLADQSSISNPTTPSAHTTSAATLPVMLKYCVSVPGEILQQLTTPARRLVAEETFKHPEVAKPTMPKVTDKGQHSEEMGSARGLAQEEAATPEAGDAVAPGKGMAVDGTGAGVACETNELGAGPLFAETGEARDLRVGDDVGSQQDPTMETDPSAANDARGILEDGERIDAADAPGKVVGPDCPDSSLGAMLGNAGNAKAVHVLTGVLNACGKADEPGSEIAATSRWSKHATEDEPGQDGTGLRKVHSREAKAEPGPKLFQQGGSIANSLAQHVEGDYLDDSIADVEGASSSMYGPAGEGSMHGKGGDKEEVGAGPEGQHEPVPEAQPKVEPTGGLGETCIEGGLEGDLSTELAARSEVRKEDDLGSRVLANYGPERLQHMVLTAAAEAETMAATAASAEAPIHRRRAVAEPLPGSLPMKAASAKQTSPKGAVPLASGTPAQTSRGLKAVSKPSGIVSQYSDIQRSATTQPGCPAGSQTALPATAFPDAGESGPTRAASTGTTASAMRSQRPADAQSLHQETHHHGKTKTYAQLYSSCSNNIASSGRVSGSGGQAGTVAAAAGRSASKLDVGLHSAVDSAEGTGQPESAKSSLARDVLLGSSGSSGWANKVDGGGPAVLNRRMPEDELGLITQVEAEALQLGLEIYAHFHGGEGSRDGLGLDSAAKGTCAGGNDEECNEEEESLEAIMAMGRRPSEIASLLLCGLATAAASVAGSDGGDDVPNEAKRRWKHEEKERRRALRREQKRHQEERRRALMGLDSYGKGSDTRREPSSSSLISSSGDSMRRHSNDGHSEDGGEIHTADSHAMMFLNAVASTGADDMQLVDRAVDAAVSHPQDLDGNLPDEGRILTSPVASALGLELLFAPVQDTDMLSVRRDDAVTDSDASGVVPSYFVDTPGLEPRVSDGMTFQPRPGSDYAPSLAPTIATSESSSTLTRTVECSEPVMPVMAPGGGSGGDVSGMGLGTTAGPAAETQYDDDEQFMAARDERSRKIAEQLAALQEESRLLQQQSMLLQERTREISRSVGLPTPPQFTNTAAHTSQLKPPRAQPHTAEPVAESSSRLEAENVLSNVNGIPSKTELSPLQHGVTSTAGDAVAVASGLADAPTPLESQPEGDLDSFDASPLRPQQAPISWALPNRSVKPVMPALAKVTASPPAQAFPLPPKGAYRLHVAQKLTHAEMQRTGSSSSLTDSLLPLWAEQVESPVMTPEVRNAMPNPKRVLPPVAGPNQKPLHEVVDWTSPGNPPQPLMQHVPRGRPGGIPSPPAAGTATGRGQGLMQGKSRLGAAVAVAMPVARQHVHAGPQTRGKIAPKQPQLVQVQPPLGRLPLTVPLGVPQRPYEPIIAAAQPPGVPPDWASVGAPLGLPQPLLPLPSLPGWPLAPDAVAGLSPMLPLFPGFVQLPAGEAAASALAAASVPAPAPAAKWITGSKGSVRPVKPPKVPPSLHNGAVRIRNGVAASNVSSNGGESNGIYGRGNVGLGMAPPPWVQGPGSAIALGDAPGIEPMLMQPPFGGLPEQLGSVGPLGHMGPWMALPQGMQHSVAGLAGDTSSRGGGAALAAFAKKEHNASTSYGHNRSYGPSKRSGEPVVASRPTPAALEEPSHLGAMPLSLPTGMLARPEVISFTSGASNGLMMPRNVSGLDEGGFNGGSSSFLQSQAQNGKALPPVKLQAGKGTMSRSAPPGSYSNTGSDVKTHIPTILAANGSTTTMEGIGLGLPMVAWPAQAIMSTIYNMVTGPVANPQFSIGVVDVHTPGVLSAEAAAMAQRADVVQQQQIERYRELENNLINKLDRQQQQMSPAGKVRDRRRNSHDGRPVFRLF